MPSAPAAGTAPDADRTDWFRQARFGLFVHYGLYAVPARHEWVMHREEIDPVEYARFADRFDPDLFDAAALARTAREAGAGYLVLTAKHHEGFCLWGTATTRFNAVEVCGRDLVREVVDAARAEGLRVGLYLSLLDWSHPDYTIDRFHPLRNRPDVAALDAGRDMARYRATLRTQLEELLTGYGGIDYLFFDFTDPEPGPARPDGSPGLPGRTAQDWDGAGLLATCRRLQPQMVVNDRLGVDADLVTPEQYQPVRPLRRDGVPVLWEACQTIGGSWGYHRDEPATKTPELLVRMLARSVSLGGNLLLNTGPTARGEVPPRDRALLEAVGAWLRHHAAAVRGAGPSPHAAAPGTVHTQRDDRLYVHVLDWPFGVLHLPGLAGKVDFARMLHDGSQVRTEEVDPDQQAGYLVPEGPEPGTLTLHLPARAPDVALPVVELFLRPSAAA